METLPASAQVLTSPALFHSVVAFIPGVPFCVLDFQRTESAEHVRAAFTQTPSPEITAHQHTYSVAKPTAPQPLWQRALVCKRKRVLTALEALASSPRYATSPHVDFTNVMSYAVLHAQDDLAFLDWLYARFRAPAQRQISCEQFGELARCSKSDSSTRVNKDALEVVQWLHARDYVFPASMMDAAAAHGNLALVRFLHEHSPSGCTTQAMDEAARFGHLDVVQFLHEHRTEGCTEFAKGRALENGHLHVLKYLQANRSEGCSAMAVLLATMQGHVACIAFAHAHGFVGFGRRVMSYAIMYGHLEIVQFLHEHDKDGCSVTALLDADRFGHTAIVDYLCRHRPMKNAGGAIREAFANGQWRLAAKLAWGMTAWEQFEYDDSSSSTTATMCPEISY